MPIAQEHILAAHHVVKGALMFGQSRQQAGILIEPHPQYAIDPQDEVALVKFRNMIWYVVSFSWHVRGLLTGFSIKACGRRRQCPCACIRQNLQGDDHCH